MLAFALYMGGWVFAIMLMASICLSIYEVYRALKLSGDRPVQWPSWVSIAVSIPLFVLTKDTNILMVLMTSACLLICIQVITRKEPRLEDLLSSALPLFSVLLPGLCILGFMRAESRNIQTMLVLMCFGIPLMGDTMAYFIGSRFGKRKLSPAISPNKSVEGAIAGLGGSVFFAILMYFIFSKLETVPPLYHFLILGVLAGVAGQVGDLFASLIKRHCGIKDFGNIFPGHGGIMDRLDSTYFAAVIIYIYFSWIMMG